MFPSILFVISSSPPHSPAPMDLCMNREIYLPDSMNLNSLRFVTGFSSYSMYLTLSHTSYKYPYAYGYGEIRENYYGYKPATYFDFAQYGDKTFYLTMNTTHYKVSLDGVTLAVEQCTMCGLHRTSISPAFFAPACTSD